MLLVKTSSLLPLVSLVVRQWTTYGRFNPGSARILAMPFPAMLKNRKLFKMAHSARKLIAARGR
jgi:hypothetical protein